MFPQGFWPGPLKTANITQINGKNVSPISAGAVFAGNGALAMTVNIKDSSSAANIQAAFVRISGSQIASNVTDSSGNAALAVNSGNVVVSVTASGYAAYNPSTHSVSVDGLWDGTTSATLSLTMTAVIIPTPSMPNQIIGLLYTRGPDDVTMRAIMVTFQMTAPAPGDTGNNYNDQPFGVMSNDDGLVSRAFTKGAKYQYKNFRGVWTPFTAPTTGTTFQIPDAVGTFTG
jgi:hypothetical protein